jgi:hypothetical protein
MQPVTITPRLTNTVRCHKCKLNFRYWRRSTINFPFPNNQTIKSVKIEGPMDNPTPSVDSGRMGVISFGTVTGVSDGGGTGVLLGGGTGVLLGGGTGVSVGGGTGVSVGAGTEVSVAGGKDVLVGGWKAGVSLGAGLGLLAAVTLGEELGVAEEMVPGLVAGGTGVPLGGMSGVRETVGSAVFEGVTVGGYTGVYAGVE